MQKRVSLAFVLTLVLLLSLALAPPASRAEILKAEIVSFTCDGFEIGTVADRGRIEFEFTLERTNPAGPTVPVIGSFSQDGGLQITSFSWKEFLSIYVLADGTLEAGDYDIPTVDVPESGTAGNATFINVNGIPLHFSDPSISCEAVGGEGCTPGYWKNHLEDWPVTGFDPADDFDTTFGVDLFDPDITLEGAVNAKGGGVKRLARHGTGALLSAAHPDVSYPLTTDQVIAAVQAGDTSTLAENNELGCSIP
jgi:hypothetical protein